MAIIRARRQNFKGSLSAREHFIAIVNVES